MAVNWAVATLGYYGLGLSSATLTSDPFLSFALSAATEIPGTTTGSLLGSEILYSSL